MFGFLTLKLEFDLIYKICIGVDLAWLEFPTGSWTYTWFLLMSM